MKSYTKTNREIFINNVWKTIYLNGEKKICINLDGIYFEVYEANHLKTRKK